jgi:uncharacterized protein DUF4411
VVYVFDSSSLVVLENYYPDRFPTFWEHLTALAAASRLQSVSEVWKELDRHNTRDFLLDWVKARQALFPTPTPAETTFVAGIFAVTRFQALVKPKHRLKGAPVADPWVIARAAQLGATVVTEESTDPKLVRIPAVCSHFKVPCMNVEGVMAKEGWRY